MESSNSENDAATGELRCTIEMIGMGNGKGREKGS